MTHPPTTGVLLANLGTPLSPKPRDVRRYLTEFLTDPRVINLPYLGRQLLVRGWIVPRRYHTSAKLYQQIWTPEGSPLLVHGKKVQQALQDILGPKFLVALGMRYQFPSLEEALQQLSSCQQLVILPLFPQYASSTTGSLLQRIMELLQTQEVIPAVKWIQSYPTQPLMIAAFAARIAPLLSQGERLVFSFHGLPQQQLQKSCPCFRSDGACCVSSPSPSCYRAHCVQTATVIADTLGLPAHFYEIAFQSRLGRAAWLQPYTSDRVEILAKQGIRNLILSCPSFVADCLETTSEIGEEYAHLFQKNGGESLLLAEGLNDHPLWIEALAQLALQA